MSDHFYAAQYRDMHTGMHNIAVFSLQERAETYLNLLDTLETFPTIEQFKLEPMNFVGSFEIDFRNPPVEMLDVSLIYVNYPEDDIPDVYR